MIRTLEQTRNKIIETHIENIKEFIAIGKYSKATTEYMWLTNNIDLFVTSPYLSNSSASLFEQAQKIMESGRKQIHDHLGSLYDTALKDYYKGDFETSREEFNQLHEEYIALKNQFKIDEDILNDVHSYIKDLMFIEKGYNDFLMEDFKKAAESFQSILHWTPALQQMMEDMRLPVQRIIQLSEPTPDSSVQDQ